MNRLPNSKIRSRQHLTLKEFLAPIASCFSITVYERLVILLISALFLSGLALRWWHRNHERSDKAIKVMINNLPQR